MLELALDNEADLPLVEQIVGGVRTRIEDRLLRPGMRLPPIRQLAESHGVSRFTVVEAYDRLVALGYLQSRRGSGFYVAPRNVPAGAEAAAPLDRAVDVVWLLRQGFEEQGAKLKAGSGWLPTSWMDEEGVLRNLRALTKRPDLRPTCYGTPQGYLPLRRQLQLRLADLGIGAGVEQIVLTHGATQALDLTARYLVRPGDTVFVDDPGYWSLFGNLRLLGAQLVGVPHTADGPDPAAMEALLQEHRPKVFFTHSVLHNPTASSLAPATAHQVLKLADRYDFLIVEDDTYADFQPDPSARLATLDQLQRVIYVGSFSKTLSGNLRVGFFACQRDLASALADIKLLSSLTTSELSERLVYRMLTEGHYRKYIERLHARMAAATAVTLRMLERQGLKLHAEPKGGMFAWASVPGIDDAAPLASRAAQAGIMLAPGGVFRPQMQPSPHLRFNVAHSTDPLLERFLADALG
jgi:DNA-binding transcriptional MocR family regulator